MEEEVGMGPTRAPQYQRATGGRLPDWYVKQPAYVRGDEFYMAAFAVLATERQLLDKGRGPIPWSKAILYAKEAGLDRRTRRWFAAVMLSLDSQWREKRRDESARDKRGAERKAERERKRQEQKTGIQKRRRAG